MTTILLVIHLLLAVALVVVVLLQRSEGGGLGIGGGGGGGLVSVRGSANLLTRATAILAASFMITSLILAVLATNTVERKSVLDTPQPQSQTEGQSLPQPGQPAVPLSK